MTLVILAATHKCVVFQSTGPETYTATVADLDRARLRIARYGDASIGPHSLDESDVIALHNAIRVAAAEAACRHHPDEPAVLDGLCGGCLRGLDARDEAATAWDRGNE